MRRAADDDAVLRHLHRCVRIPQAVVGEVGDDCQPRADCGDVECGRIVLTAILYEIAGRWPAVLNLETSGETIHNWAGYLMMPFGLLLLLVEMSLLSKLLIAPMPDRPLAVDRVLAGGGIETTVQPVPRRRRR